MHIWEGIKDIKDEFKTDWLMNFRETFRYHKLQRTDIPGGSVRVRNVIKGIFLRAEFITLLMRLWCLFEDQRRGLPDPQGKTNGPEKIVF